MAIKGRAVSSHEPPRINRAVAGTGLSFFDWWFIAQLALLLDPRDRVWWQTWSPSIAIGLLLIVFAITDPLKDTHEPPTVP